MALGAGGAVVRLSKVIGPHLGLFRTWIDTLRAGGGVNAFTDLLFAPIALSTLTDMLTAFAAAPASGVWHMGGPRDVSYYEAANWLADRLGVSPGLVSAASAAEIGVPAAERPPHTVLDARITIERLGFGPGRPAVELERGLKSLLPQT